MGMHEEDGGSLNISVLLYIFNLFNFFYSHPRIFFHCFLDSGEGREEGTESNIDWKEKHPLVASCTCPDWWRNPQLRYFPDQEPTQNLLVVGWCSNQLSHTSQGLTIFSCLKMLHLIFLCKLLIIATFFSFYYLARPVPNTSHVFIYYSLYHTHRLYIFFYFYWIFNEKTFFKTRDERK